MPGELIINAASYETRVALVENGHVVELFIERHTDRTIVGNIYKGKVVKVLPGMQSAFVDIGLPKAAFLYVGDVCVKVDESLARAFGDDLDQTDLDPQIPSAADVPIEDRLREGQDILVQVAKEPLGSKGARVTTQITIPGRNLVLMPMVKHVGVSRRIDDENEREKLREIMLSIKRDD